MPILFLMTARKRRLTGYIETALDCLLRDPRIPSFPLGKEYLILSDFHLGDKSDADNFKKNEEIACEMMEYYSKKGVIIIINGDFEELWQFSCESIRKAYHRFFSSLKGLFGSRVIRLYGNHDADGPYRGFYPGIILTGSDTDKPLLITHGHLGSSESDLYSWFSRICVRLFRYLEPICLKTGVIRAPIFKRPCFRHEFEHIHNEWARKRGCRIICGHSHRAVFASRSFYEKLKGQRRKSKKLRDKTILTGQIIKEIIQHRNMTFDVKNESVYFNCGCGLYKRGITALEISGFVIRLVKWEKRGRRVFDEMDLKEQ